MLYVDYLYLHNKLLIYKISTVLYSCIPTLQEFRCADLKLGTFLEHQSSFGLMPFPIAIRPLKQKLGES